MCSFALARPGCDYATLAFTFALTLTCSDGPMGRWKKLKNATETTTSKMCQQQQQRQQRRALVLLVAQYCCGWLWGARACCRSHGYGSANKNRNRNRNKLACDHSHAQLAPTFQQQQIWPIKSVRARRICKQPASPKQRPLFEMRGTSTNKQAGRWAHCRARAGERLRVEMLICERKRCASLASRARCSG